jgi:hypothetical protein
VQCVHPPKNPVCGPLSISASNILATTMVLPRSFKPMKMNEFNDSYDMVKFGGGLKGLDSCSITLNKRFDRGN